MLNIICIINQLWDYSDGALQLWLYYSETKDDSDVLSNSTTGSVMHDITIFEEK